MFGGLMRAVAPTLMEKISEVDPRALAAVRRSAGEMEDFGQKSQRYGYGGGALALGASFLPGIRQNPWARRALRTGAVGGGATGLLGGYGKHIGRGYSTAADVAEGKYPADGDVGDPAVGITSQQIDLSDPAIAGTMSPSAFRSASRFLARHTTPRAQPEAQPQETPDGG